MFRSARKTLNSLSRLLSQTPARTVRRQCLTYSRFRPTLDCLEDRCLPTTFVWVGVQNQSANWSTAANWSVDGNPATVIPGPSDDVVFDGNTSSNNSTVDTGFPGTVKSVTIKSTYGGTITLAASLTATTTEQDAGTVNGSGTYFVPSGGSYTWTGGTLQGTADSEYAVQVAANATFTFNAGLLNSATLDGRWIINYGSFQSVNGGTINVSNDGGIDNLAGSTVQIVRSDVKPGASPLGREFVAVLQGSTLTATTANINVEFDNYGVVTVQGGSGLDLGGGGKESGTFTVSPGAQLNLTGNGRDNIYFLGATLRGGGRVWLNGETALCVTNPSGPPTVVTDTGTVLQIVEGGALSGTGELDIRNGATLLWSGGSMGVAGLAGGKTKIGVNSTLDIADASSANDW